MRCTLATGGDAIVTDRAVIHEIGMVNVGRYPRRSGMTIVALLRRDNMRRWFTAGGDIVVTTGTGANHLRVIHGTGRDRRPRG